MQAWPVADPALVVAETIELPVQVDGKLRDRLVVTPDTPADEIERMALASEHVQRYLAGREPGTVIQIPGPARQRRHADRARGPIRHP